MAHSGEKLRLPDGISNAGLDHGLGGWWSVIRLALIGGVLLLAILGVLGSGEPEPTVVKTGDTRLIVETPVPLRNGMFFETRVLARSARSIGDAVVAVPAGVWRDITVNSMVPAASDEEYRDGYFLFHFGPLEPGRELLFKLDGQINPSREADVGGHIEFRDGDRTLARAPFRIEVIG